MDHLLRDSHQLAFELQGQRLDPDDRMMRVDIKDFFMSGDAESLVVDACSIIPGGDLRAVAERVAFFLLRNQLIRSDLLPNRCWRVIKGSGMGLKHSSALCDAALFAKCERPFILNKAAAQFFGIKYYRRFKDDMFAIVTTPGKAGAWLHCVRKRCKGTFLINVRKLFKRSCDNVGSETAQGSPWNCSHRASSIDIGWANFEHYLCTSFQCSSRLAFSIVKESVEYAAVLSGSACYRKVCKTFCIRSCDT